jgi:hypothetical protein
MTIIIDVPVKNELEKKLLTEYLKLQAEIFLKYYSMPEFKIKPEVEEEIISRKEDDYIEIEDIDEFLELLEKNDESESF